MPKSCQRCYGSGLAPSDPKGLLCKDCYGSGKTGPDILLRLDGRVEQLCVHGVGHTICVKACKYPYWTHGCDGCCQDFARVE